MNLNWKGFYAKLDILRRYQDVLESQQELLEGHIAYHQMFTFLVNNGIYDIINMNTFNFIRAVFNELLFRLPTDQNTTLLLTLLKTAQPVRPLEDTSQIKPNTWRPS
ncbi:MAG: hypothetical protein IPI30_21690 [Saprospiraceae bacterium]|nr:hypothetical protein [Candidatus Vicinibacter affinis]